MKKYFMTSESLAWRSPLQAVPLPLCLHRPAQRDPGHDHGQQGGPHQQRGPGCEGTSGKVPGSGLQQGDEDSHEEVSQKLGFAPFLVLQ